MAPKSSTGTSLRNGEHLLSTLVRGERGKALRAQLAGRYPDISADEIEDAIQYACKSFLDEAEAIDAPGQVYAWIRTAAFRSLGHEAKRHGREIAVDPAGGETLEPELLHSLLKRGGVERDGEDWRAPDGRRTTAVGDALVWALERIAQGLMVAGDAVDGGNFRRFGS